MKLVLLLLAGMLLSGCVAPGPPAAGTEDGTQRPYVSEIALPEAKAYFAYAQFRLLIADNRWDEAISALERALAFDPHSETLQLTLSRAYLHTRQIDKGGAALETLLKDHPDQLTGWELLGELRFFQERYPEAIAAYRQGLKLNPGAEQLRLHLIALYDHQQEREKAIAETNTLLGLNPDSLAGRLALARLQRDNGQPDEALKTYRDLLQRHPGQLQVILELGQLLEKEKRFDKAIELYRQNIKNHPELLPVYKQLARLLVLQERYAEALELLQRARQQDPDDVQVLTRIGLLQLERGDYPAAEETFRDALQVQPSNPHNLFSLGMALIGQQRDVEALSVLKLIPRESEVYAEAALQIGYLYRQQGKLEQGIAEIRDALQNNDRSPDLYYYLSAFLGEADRFDEAADAAKQGIEHYPQEARLHYQLGVTYERKGQRDQALGEMREVLKLRPQDPDALNFIAYHYAERGEKLDQALKQAQQALAQKQTSYIYDTLGWIYYRMQRFAEAQRNLELAVALDPQDALIHEHLGDAYAAGRLWQKAVEIYRQTLELDDVSNDVNDKLQRLLKDHPPR